MDFDRVEPGVDGPHGRGGEIGDHAVDLPSVMADGGT